MFETIYTFWSTFLGSEVLGTLLTVLSVGSAVWVLYLFLLRPFVALITRSKDGVLKVLDVSLAVVMCLSALFSFSPNFLNAEQPEPEIIVEPIPAPEFLSDVSFSNLTIDPYPLLASRVYYCGDRYYTAFTVISSAYLNIGSVTLSWNGLDNVEYLDVELSCFNFSGALGQSSYEVVNDSLIISVSNLPSNGNVFVSVAVTADRSVDT